MKRRLRLKIYGLVQGVGFRFFIVRHATNLGLTGWVRNLSDGGVEAVAEGEEWALRELVRLCERGPIGAEVEKLDVDYEEYRGGFKDFRIVY